MEDLEKAILISFDESGTVDSGLKNQALNYCREVKENPSICRICLEGLALSKLVQVQFWCLQCLHDVVRSRYSVLNLEEKSFIRNSVFAMVCYRPLEEKSGAVLVLDGPAFVKNKLAQVLVTLISFEYPLVWSSVFVDLMGNLNKGAVVIDMFCRVLNSLDDELINQDYPRSAEEVAVAGRVKDAMRQQCVPQIVRAWYDIVSMYRNSDPELCTSVLETMSRYISWIDIGLIVNDVVVPLLFELILVDGALEQLRGAAASCVLAVVTKRMDPQSKLSLLQSLQMNRVFGLVADSDSELGSKVGELLIGYASEVLECSKRVSSEDVKGASVELLNEVLPSVFYVMQNCEVDVAFNIVQFLSSYVSTMKTLSPLREKQMLHVGQILEVIRTQILYDPLYRQNLDVLDKIGQEEEDRMIEFRKDLFVLLHRLCRVAPDVTQMFIRNSLASAAASSPERNVEEVEAALSLLYALGEAVSDEAMRNGSGLLGELMNMLLSIKLPCHANRLVALVYLETITRYIKFVQENTQFVPIVLAAFLDHRGIHHPNVNVSRRASYLFMRVVKALKAKLVPFIENILQVSELLWFFFLAIIEISFCVTSYIPAKACLSFILSGKFASPLSLTFCYKIFQSLQDSVARFTNTDCSEKDLSGSEDGSHIFEAIGLLIGMEDVPPEKQSEYLSSLLIPLCRQVEASLRNAEQQQSQESPTKLANIMQIIMAINAVSKGFSERLVTASRPSIGLMFKQTLDVLLQILVVFPKVEPLRIKVTSFIHRMVETLGSSVFPYLPKALEQLLAEIELKEMVGFLTLINQLICKFDTAVRDILEEVFPSIASKIFSILPRDGIPSGPGSNTEEIRELQELQRTFYTFLHVITTHGLSSIFLSPKCRAYLDAIMQLLLSTSCNHKDINVRKACVQIFIRLIKDWCSRPPGEEKVPGFQNFIIEAFAPNCCFFSVLDKSFEFRDANTLVLFGEIVTAQKVMYEKFGNDFLVRFVSKGFPTVHCPQDMAEQYCQKLQGDDIKALRSFYQSLIENLRLQQNGSLVFR